MLLLIPLISITIDVVYSQGEIHIQHCDKVGDEILFLSQTG